MIQILDEFLQRIHLSYTSDDAQLIERALSRSDALHKGQLRQSGEPHITHPLQVAELLLDMKMDGVTIAAALLHDTLEDTTMTRDELRSEFGEEVESLVFGVTKIDIVNTGSKNAAEVETVRKMLFAMVKDIRVILIKLADKLHNMRTLQFKSVDRQKAIAQDTLDIYAPLAARLGISWMKDELEDLSLKVLQNDVYRQIKEYVAAKKGERAVYLDRVKKAIIDAAGSESISVEVETRAKHFYSIYAKMKERNKKLDEIYDLLGIRILCTTMHECYIALGLVHRLWMPIEGRFKDYIAMPKSNRYQSLHTTVMCYDGRLTEIQIRTHDMNETAEFGVAAHWLYKKKNAGQRSDAGDLSIISKLKDFDGRDFASADFLDEIKRELLKDSIYVFTPRGDVIQLPKGATAIDIAYHIHTEVGHHAAAAKADGSIIPLKAPLKNTQVIEIITNAQARPHVDWLRYVKTSRTRHKIRVWLNRHDENVFIDRNIVARKPGGEPGGNGLGSGSSLAHPGKSPAHTKQQTQAPVNERKPIQPGESTPIETPRAPIKVGNERNMMIRFANCCTPITGDDIIGYVSRGRGIIIHRRDCTNIAHIPDLLGRSIEVEWETISPRQTRTIKVSAHKVNNLFGEVESVVKKHKGNLVFGKLEETHEGLLEGRFAVELPRREDFKKILKDLRQIKSLIAVSDIGDSETF